MKPSQKSPGATADAVRLDIWLWAARFFRTRTLSSSAISGGHVKLNGSTTKPGKLIHINDELRIKKGPDIYSITVRALSSRRLGAGPASELYQEHEQSVLERESGREQRRLQRQAVRYPQGNPGRRNRRLLREIKQGRGD